MISKLYTSTYCGKNLNRGKKINKKTGRVRKGSVDSYGPNTYQHRAPKARKVHLNPVDTSVSASSLKSLYS